MLRKIGFIIGIFLFASVASAQITFTFSDSLFYTPTELEEIADKKLSALKVKKTKAEKKKNAAFSESIDRTITLNIPKAPKKLKKPEISPNIIIELVPELNKTPVSNTAQVEKPAKTISQPTEKETAIAKAPKISKSPLKNIITAKDTLPPPSLSLKEDISNDSEDIELMVVEEAESKDCNDLEALKGPIQITKVEWETVKNFIETIQSDIPLPYNKYIQNHIDYFTLKDPSYIKLMLRREYKFMSIFESALLKHGLPTELKNLVIVESGLSPKAISRSGAGGLWQFMPSTGGIFDLKINRYVDERMDPYKSSEAAALYLKELYETFDDWHLALAAYNCGPGAINRALKRHRAHDFWSVYRHLPRETKSYVPSFIAFNFIVQFSHLYNVCADTIENSYEYETIPVEGFVKLNELGEELNIDTKSLLAHNPELRTYVVPGRPEAPYQLRIPFALVPWKEEIKAYAIAHKFDEEPDEIEMPGLAQQSSSRMKQITYSVKRGDVLARIASKYNVAVRSINKWNNISKNRIYPGQKLVLYVPSKSDHTKVSTQRKQITSLQSSHLKNAKTHRVSVGDTLWSISRKYQGISIAKLKALNNLENNTIKPGQTLILPATL